MYEVWYCWNLSEVAFLSTSRLDFNNGDVFLRLQLNIHFIVKAMEKNRFLKEG